MKHKIQFTLSKMGIAWMFALLTVNFNRVAIVDLGVPALLLATMIGIYPFWGLVQPRLRLLSAHLPIFGYRTSAWLVLGMLGGSAIFPLLPNLAVAMARGEALPALLGFVAFAWFGLMIALMANTYLDLIAACTREDDRGAVFAAAWTGQTASIVLWAAVFAWVMPVFDLARMQVLYSVTPLIILMLGLASVWGLEKRGAPAPEARSFNTIASSLALLRGNMQAQRFFACVILTFIGIFTQDLLQEVWAGELFGMTAGPSVLFQQLFNGLVTLGMAAGGIATAVVLKRRGSAAKTLPVDERRWIGVRAGMIASIGFVTLALASARSDFTTALLGFVLQGAAVGVYTFAAVTMMSDMTVEGLTANYLGLWSIAQAIGLGASFVVSGLLHSLLRDVAMLPLTQVYAAIFLLQATAMLVCTALMRGASVERLRISAPGVSGSSAPVPLEVA